jgi:hypothetical protein
MDYGIHGGLRKRLTQVNIEFQDPPIERSGGFFYFGTKRLHQSPTLFDNLSVWDRIRPMTPLWIYYPASDSNRFGRWIKII